MYNNETRKRPSADDENNSALPRLIDSFIEGWTARWVMLSDGRIGCTSCESAQFASDAWARFPHAVECRYRNNYLQHPWIDLRAHLARIPQDV